MPSGSLGGLAGVRAVKRGGFMPWNDETILFDKYLEYILPVKNVIRQPGIPVSMGTSYRNWKADYVFKLAGQNFVVEVKLAQGDMPMDGAKVLAYQKLFNYHTAGQHSALIVVRADNANNADLLMCGLLRISILTMSFEEIDKNVFKYRAKLDGTINYEAICGHGISDRPLESKNKGLWTHLVDASRF